jgi:DNA-binding transcriptional ArsR family regulator
MEEAIPTRLAALGHPQRLAILRLLMRRFPDRLPAGDIAQALDLKPSTLSNYLSHLMQVGLVTQERIGTSLRYCPDMETLRGTFGFLWRDCCRGRPDLCPPFAPFPDSGAETMTHVPFKRPLHLHRQLGPVDLRRNAPAHARRRAVRRALGRNAAAIGVEPVRRAGAEGQGP